MPASRRPEEVPMEEVVAGTVEGLHQEPGEVGHSACCVEAGATTSACARG